MSKNRFFLSDHHMGHDKIYNFKDDEGNRIRPWADSAAEADEMMVAAHNSVVRQGDTVYFGGDVAIKAKALDLLHRMNGRKILIRGNHDIFKLKQYLPHFADIRATHKIDRVIISHYPLHPESLPHWCLGNAHGHTHDRVVRDAFGTADPRYLNFCVERVGLTPLPFEEIVARLEAARPDFRAGAALEVTDGFECS